MKLIFLLSAALLLQTAAVLAQKDTARKTETDEMNVDMPDATQETDLIHKKQLQVETGMLYTRYKKGPASVIGQSLIRYGILERLEVRVLIEEGRHRDRYIEETVQSTYPLALSTKIALVKDVKGLPDITLVSYLRLPLTNRSSEQKGYWSPIVLAAFQHKFAHNKFKLEYNIGGQQEAYSTDWVVLANASLHYSFTNALEIYAEYYAQYQPGEEPRHNIGGGVSYEIGHSWEVFASAGGSIHQQEESNHYFNGGAAFRIP